MAVAHWSSRRERRMSEAMMDPREERLMQMTRRQFFGRTAGGIGTLALASLLGTAPLARAASVGGVSGLPSLPHFAPKAKRAIYLHMVGAPPQMDLFDYKPGMTEWYDKDLPDSIRKGQRLTTMTSGQTRFPVAPSVFKFAQLGWSGARVRDVLTYTALSVDECAIIGASNPSVGDN